MNLNDPLPVRMIAFFNRVTTDREAALEDLTHVYARDIHFISPVVDSSGIDVFAESWRRAFRQYKMFVFKNLAYTGDEQRFTLTYEMHIRFAFGPVFVTQMATECEANGEKLVATCRDYFDPLGSLLGAFPPLSWVYKKLFGLVVA